MVQSTAKTVTAYLAALEPDKKKTISRVRKCIRDNIPKDYVEVMNWGMITYEVPLKRYPDTYNKKPLLYCALAAQKHHFAVYLMTIYTGSKFLRALQTGYKKADMKLDVGKCCIRFTNLEGIHLPTLSKLIAACPVEEFISLHEVAHKK